MNGRLGETAMKKFLAIGLACCLPPGLAAEDPADGETYLGTVSVLVIEDATPAAGDVLCKRGAATAAECMTVNRAVLTAHVEKVPARERGRWM
jgi:hypothetical protein